MVEKAIATMTSKGQITVPAEIRKQWGLKPGDQIAFERVDENKGIVRPRRRRSIFESREELMLPSLGKPLTQTDIDAAIAKSIAEKLAAKRARER